MTMVSFSVDARGRQQTMGVSHTTATIATVRESSGYKQIQSDAKLQARSASEWIDGRRSTRLRLEYVMEVQTEASALSQLFLGGSPKFCDFG